jgi:hypothetical protein
MTPINSAAETSSPKSNLPAIVVMATGRQLREVLRRRQSKSEPAGSGAKLQSNNQKRNSFVFV